MSKGSLKIIAIFSSIIIFIILFLAIYAANNEESEPIYKPNNKTNSKVYEEEDNFTKRNFLEVKYSDLCEEKYCENIIFKFEDNSTLKYSNKEKEKIFYNDESIYELQSTPKEFIKLDEKYILIIYDTYLEIIDIYGNKEIEDKYLLSEIKVKKSSVEYKTMDCETDDYEYNAVIKMMEKPVIILSITNKENKSACL